MLYKKSNKLCKKEFGTQIASKKFSRKVVNNACDVHELKFSCDYTLEEKAEIEKNTQKIKQIKEKQKIEKEFAEIEQKYGNKIFYLQEEPHLFYHLERVNLLHLKTLGL